MHSSDFFEARKRDSTGKESKWEKNLGGYHCVGQLFFAVMKELRYATL